MSVYLDASVIAPLFVQEDTSDRVIAWLSPLNAVIVSDWAIAEVSSALSHHVRSGQLDADERDLCEAARREGVTVIVP